MKYLHLTTVENSCEVAVHIVPWEVLIVFETAPGLPYPPQIKSRLVGKAGRPDILVTQDHAWIVREIEHWNQTEDESEKEPKDTPSRKTKVSAKAGPAPSARHFESFAVYRPFFPKPEQPGADLNTIQKAANATKPISRGRLYEAIQEWISMGLVELIPAIGQGTATYRLMPYAVLPKEATPPIEIDLSEPGKPEEAADHLPFG